MYFFEVTERLTAKCIYSCNMRVCDRFPSLCHFCGVSLKISLSKSMTKENILFCYHSWIFRVIRGSILLTEDFLVDKIYTNICLVTLIMWA